MGISYGKNYRSEYKHDINRDVEMVIELYFSGVNLSDAINIVTKDIEKREELKERLYKIKERYYINAESR